MMQLLVPIALNVYPLSNISLIQFCNLVNFYVFSFPSSSQVMKYSDDCVKKNKRRQSIAHLPSFDINVDLMTDTIFYFNGNRNEILSTIFFREVYLYVYCIPICGEPPSRSPSSRPHLQ